MAGAAKPRAASAAQSIFLERVIAVSLSQSSLIRPFTDHRHFDGINPDLEVSAATWGTHALSSLADEDNPFTAFSQFLANAVIGLRPIARLLKILFRRPYEGSLFSRLGGEPHAFARIPKHRL